MPMCVVVTRDVPLRFRGFLASCMLEIAPGVYTQPDMSAAVRERIWNVLRGWWIHYFQGSVVMTWSTPSSSERQQVLTLGEPAKDLVEVDGIYLVRRQESADSTGVAERSSDRRSGPSGDFPAAHDDASG